MYNIVYNRGQVFKLYKSPKSLFIYKIVSLLNCVQNVCLNFMHNYSRKFTIILII